MELRSDKEAWKAHDATELIKKHKGAFECLIDVVRFAFETGEMGGVKDANANENRERAIISINKDSCFQRISLRLRRRQEMMEHWRYGIRMYVCPFLFALHSVWYQKNDVKDGADTKRATTTPTSSSPPSQAHTSTTLQNSSSHSTYVSSFPPSSCPII